MDFAVVNPFFIVDTADCYNCYQNLLTSRLVHLAFQILRATFAKVLFIYSSSDIVL